MGCDTAAMTRYGSILSFQSTHPHGVRLTDTGDDLGVVPISIHAPAWGATNYLRRLWLDLYNFNPRTRMGCDC